MHGIDPYAYLQQLAGRLETLGNRDDVESALDDAEYLYEVMDPELQHLADDLIDRLRERLKGMT